MVMRDEGRSLYALSLSGGNLNSCYQRSVHAKPVNSHLIVIVDADQVEIRRSTLSLSTGRSISHGPVSNKYESASWKGRDAAAL